MCGKNCKCGGVCKDKPIDKLSSGAYDSPCECASPECQEPCQVPNTLVVNTEDIFWSGCDLFNLGIREGDNMTQVITQVENVVNGLVKKIMIFNENNLDLQQEIKDLKTRIKKLEHDNMQAGI